VIDQFRCAPDDVRVPVRDGVERPRV